MQQDSLKNLASEVTNFLLISELLWSVAENITGTQVTMKEQESYPLFTTIRKQMLYAFPQLSTIHIVF
jgi:hypothetical protein